MSENKEKFNARLMAVQALYQASQNKDSIENLADEYIEHRSEDTPCDADLFNKIMSGILEQSGALETLIDQEYSKENNNLEPLLKAILLCGAFELKNHQDIDFPIIINDYLNITHSFYEQGEVSLVNGLLEKLAK